MKIQGLFIHRIKRGQPKNKIDFEQQIDQNANENALGLEKFIKKYEITNETVPKKIHLFYCCTYPMLKYILFIGWLFFMIFNRETEIKDELGFFYWQIVNILLALYFFQMPIYFMVAVSSKNGFYRSVLSFEFIEKKIKRHFEVLNQLSNNKNPIRHSCDKNVSKLSILFCMCASILILAYFLNSIIQNKDTLILHWMIDDFCFVLILIDWATIINFLTVNILLVYNQIDSFCKYLIAVSENQIENKINNGIDVDTIRDFYNDLYEHVKITDQWMCYFYGMIYCFSIPSISIFIYSVYSAFSSNIELLCFVSSYLITIIIIIAAVLLVTLVAIILNIKVFKLCTFQSFI